MGGGTAQRRTYQARVRAGAGVGIHRHQLAEIEPRLAPRDDPGALKLQHPGRGAHGNRLEPDETALGRPPALAPGCSRALGPEARPSKGTAPRNPQSGRVALTLNPVAQLRYFAVSHAEFHSLLPVIVEWPFS
jgi:hypothetical protein